MMLLPACEVSNQHRLDNSEPERLCLCVSGGSGYYTFSVASGSLPEGVGINPATECVTAVSPRAEIGGSGKVNLPRRRQRDWRIGGDSMRIQAIMQAGVRWRDSGQVWLEAEWRINVAVRL